MCDGGEGGGHVGEQRLVLASVFYDSKGRRKARSLGPKSDISRRQALVLCERIAVELHSQPQRADMGRPPSLQDWTDQFLALKPDLGTKARRSYRGAAERFAEFAGPQTRLDRITSAIAAEWVTLLASPGSRGDKNEKDTSTLAPATVAHYCRHVRCMFNEAVHHGILVTNPFARVRTQPRKIERSWHYVDRATLTRVLEQCRNDGWKCFIALQRLGALRKGESLAVEWRMIDWNRRILTLPENVTKTGQERMVPLDPALFALLERVHKSRASDSGLIVPLHEVDRRSDSNQHSRFRTALKNAGIIPWEDLFQTLRRNAVQDLRETLKDPWAVTAIAGHSEEVERKYYLGHVRSSDIDQITGKGRDAELEAVTVTWPKLSRSARDAILAIVRQTSSADGQP